MVGNITDNDFDFTFFIFAVFQVIKIIPTGLLTVDAFAGNFQAFDAGVRARQKVLLDIHSQPQRLAHPVPFFETFCHFIDYITCITDFIIAGHANLFVKYSVSYPAKCFNNFSDGQG